MGKYRDEVITPGDRFSKLAHEICEGSYHNCPAVTVHSRTAGRFRGAVDFEWQPHVLRAMAEGRVRQTIQNDGAGGKPQFATLFGKKEGFKRLGWEIITMTADDVVAGGGFPAVMANQIDVKQITAENFTLCQGLLEGYGEALKRAALVNLTGESAVMKDSITAFCDTNDPHQLILTWSGTCFGLARTDLVLDGSTITPDMAIVGLLETCYRCNGGTALTRIIMNTWGRNPEALRRSPEALDFAERLTMPSRSYARTIARLLGWSSNGTPTASRVRIHAVVHVTGGGVWGKLGEILPPNVGAHLNTMPDPPIVLLEAQRLSKHQDHPLTDEECYGTFHGGCGMFVICHKDDVPTVTREAQKDNHRAVPVGTTTESANNEIIIESRFAAKKRLSSLEHA